MVIRASGVASHLSARRRRRLGFGIVSPVDDADDDDRANALEHAPRVFPVGRVPAHVFHAGVMTGLEPLEEVADIPARHGRCDSDVIEAQA